MRHGMRDRKLGRTSSHREALFRNQLQSLVDNERIVTTLPKAKELRPIAERVITRGKHGTLHDRRWVLRWVLKPRSGQEGVRRDRAALHRAAGRLPADRQAGTPSG